MRRSQQKSQNPAVPLNHHSRNKTADSQPIHQMGQKSLKADRRYPRGVETFVRDAHVSLALATVLDMCSHPKHGEAEMRNLARTTPLYRELRALRDLWQALGRPESKLWWETRVFYNRIVNSYP